MFLPHHSTDVDKIFVFFGFNPMLKYEALRALYPSILESHQVPIHRPEHHQPISTHTQAQVQTKFPENDLENTSGIHAL
jgi:hypothetical protein